MPSTYSNTELFAELECPEKSITIREEFINTLEEKLPTSDVIEIEDVAGKSTEFFIDNSKSTFLKNIDTNAAIECASTAKLEESQLFKNLDSRPLENIPNTTDLLFKEEDVDSDSATDSLHATIEEENNDRSDGSDSGLGSELCEERQKIIYCGRLLEDGNQEISFFDKFNSTEMGIRVSKNDNEKDLTTESSNVLLENEEIKTVPKEIRSSLKRKAPIDDSDEQPKLKKSRGVSFDSVTVYYFPRAQGFTCVPSQGGSTLGMSRHHVQVRKFSITEHAIEQRRVHRQMIQQIRTESAKTPSTSTATSSEESESEEEQSDVSENEIDMDNYYMLQPVPTRQRRALLRAAGVRKIETYERDDCRDIRTSREFCGCGCKGYCDPETCSCSQAGIKCQVDRLNFPCGCSRDSCGNSSGRIEFNPVRVRTHFIHTLMRLELEKKQEKDGNKGWIDERTDQCGSRNEACSYNIYGETSRTVAASFPNLPARTDSLDLYSFREDCYTEESSRDDRKHASFSHSPGFHGFNDPRYGEVGYPTSVQYATAAQPNNQYPPAYQSGFQDFNPMTYNSYYGEFHEQQKLNHEEGFQNYDQYVDNFGQTKENHYTNLSPVIGSSNGKIESITDLMSGRYNSYLYSEPEFSNLTTKSDEDAEKNELTNTSSSDDCSSDNFGEIIKKSIVETVSA